MVYEHLDTNQTIEHIGKSARKVLAGMCVGNLGVFITNHLSYYNYNSLVVPVLDYGACLW